jgi:hypothetical protein
MIKFIEYSKIMLSPFFNWWWATLTGVISIISFLAIPKLTLELNTITVFTLAFIFSANIFLLITLFLQSWKFFNYKNFDLTILRFNKDKEHGGKYTFIEANQSIDVGTLLAIRWNINDSETLIGILEIISKNNNGNLVAKDYYIKPVHQKSLNENTIKSTSIMASTKIPKNILMYLENN